MSITPYLPNRIRQGNVFTWVNSQWKLGGLPGHFSAEINTHLTPHRFRHSAATLLIEEGIDIRMVQALLGHANLRTTEIYVQVSNHALRSALERADVLDVLSK